MVTKLKPLLPSLREKKRYVAFEVLAQNSQFDAQEVDRAVTQELHRLVGDLGARDAGMIFMHDLYKKNKGIMRINHKHVDTLKATFTLTKEIHKQPIAIQSLGASGVLAQSKKYL